METTQKLIFSVIGALCLSGCASVFGTKQAAMQHTDRVDVAQVYHEYANEQLEAGRSQLRAGAYASALDSLRKASHDPKSAPAAYNAMGVAYLKLGREDVATRLFTLALMLEPGNQAFASNLKRLKVQALGKSENVARELAVADQVESDKPSPSPVNEKVSTFATSKADQAQVLLVASAYGRNLSTTSGTGGMRRISAHEVRIGKTGQTPGSHQDAVAASRYPVKIDFHSTENRRQNAHTDRASYPQRIDF